MGTLLGLLLLLPPRTDLAVLVTLLLACALGLHMLLRAAHPRWRVVVFRAVVCSVAALLLGRALPRLELALGTAPSTESRGTRMDLPARTTSVAPRPVAPAISTAPAESPGAVEATAATAATAAAAPDPPARQSSATAGQAMRSSLLPREVRGFISAIAMLLFLYAILLMLLGDIRVLRLRAAPAELLGEFADLRRQLGLTRRSIRLGIDPDIGTPYVCGGLRTAIALPASARTWSPAERRVALTHELMHIQHRDLGWIFFFSLVRAIFWWNPLAWWAAAAHRRACEEAADLEAARALGDIEDYRTLLARLAMELFQGRESRPGALALGMVRRSEVRARLDRLAEVRGARRTPTFAIVIAFLVFAGFDVLANVAQLKPAPAHVPDAFSDAVTSGTRTLPVFWRTPAARLTPEEVSSLETEALAERLGSIEGDLELAAMFALMERAAAHTEAAREILLLLDRVAQDPKEPLARRLQAVYVVAACGAHFPTPSVSWLAGADPEPAMRAAAVCALGMRDRLANRKRLDQLAKSEKNAAVRGWIRRAMANDFLPPGTRFRDLDPAQMTGEQLGERNERALHEGDLTLAFDSTMRRVLARKQSGHRYRDKIDLASDWESYFRLNPQKATEKRAVLASILPYCETHKAEPEYDWRVAHLLATAHADLGDHKEARAFLEAALTRYPPPAYSDPARHSKYQHLINQLAFVVWEHEGIDAAETLALERAKSDPKLQYFFLLPWEQRYEQLGQKARYERFRNGLAEVCTARLTHQASRGFERGNEIQLLGATATTIDKASKSMPMLPIVPDPADFPRDTGAGLVTALTDADIARMKFRLVAKQLVVRAGRLETAQGQGTLATDGLVFAKSIQPPDGDSGPPAILERMELPEGFIGWLCSDGSFGFARREYFDREVGARLAAPPRAVAR